jgi:hypothetical protein
LSATIGQRFRWGRVTADVLDFNRHGMSVRLPRPLPGNQPLEIQLDFGDLHIPDIVGVIHNSRCLRDGSVRYGVQFRTGARTQLDRNAVRAQLARLEGELAAAQETTEVSD